MKRFLGFFSATLLVLFLAACGGGSSSSSTVGGSGTEVTEDNLFEFTTAAQVKAETFRTEMTMSVLGQEITMSGVTKAGDTLEDVAMDMTMTTAVTGTEQEMRMILVDGIFYMNRGDLSGGKFASFDSSDEDNPMGEQIQQMRESSDPAAQLEAVKEALKSVEKVGDGGTIDGVSTTEFLVIVDSSKLDQSAAAAGMPETVEYRMWVGEDGLLRKMTLDIAGVVTEVLWTDWGKPVDISAPSADEITDADIPGLTS